MLSTLASNIDKSKYDVVVIVLNDKYINKFTAQLDNNGVRVRYMTGRNRNPIVRKVKRYIWLCKTLQEEKPDIMHIHLDYNYSWLYAIVHNKRIITTIHSQSYRIDGYWTRLAVKYLNSRKHIRLVTLTESGAEETAGRFRIGKDEIRVIPNMVCLEQFGVDGREYSEKEDICFTFVARFNKIKNHGMLLEAFALVLKIMPRARLELVGDGELLRQEEGHANVLGIASNVVFHGEVNDVEDILRETDVFVISSDSESFSIVLIEAMASGLPVVATAVGGIRDIVDGNGILVPKGDTEGFADAMIKMAQNAGFREKCGQRSLELVQKYELLTVVKQYEELYDEEEYDRRKT